jgi:ABC-type Fe3+/spermidine/putrescine transport system ATPase subunit
MSAAPQPYVVIRSVSKSFAGTAALREITLEMPRGEQLGLLGPSGSGKTTLLNILGGFTAPDEGVIEIDGRDLLEQPPFRRDLGIVFQGYALFPHLTVFENVAFGLRQRRLAQTEIKARVTSMLDLVGLAPMARRYPSTLSGGEQQRTALARALVIQPRLMLLDEPLANLDANLRQRMRYEIREILRRTNVTSIFVTHDQEEAFALCDRVAVLYQGQLQQAATPEDIVNHPATAFVAGFIGRPNVIEGAVVASTNSATIVEVETGHMIIQAFTAVDLRAGAQVKVYLRPADVRVTPLSGEREAASFLVKDAVFLGRMGREVLLDGAFQLRCVVPADDSHIRPGMNVKASWDPERAYAFAVEG